MDGNNAECLLYVGFCQEGPLAQADYCSGYVIDGNVGERAGVLSYGVTDALVLGC